MLGKPARRLSQEQGEITDGLNQGGDTLKWTRKDRMSDTSKEKLIGLDD